LLSQNLISDLENAVATRSAEAGPMLRRVTDLFLLNAGHYTADQLELYDGILNMLIAAVEISARADLARRLAPVDGALPKIIRALALDDAIEVAEPVLAQSNALDDDILTHCITIKGQEHLLAIALVTSSAKQSAISWSLKVTTKFCGLWPAIQARQSPIWVWDTRQKKHRG
jgi:uncharacterized protein (DUF2336 family)